jgi:DNA-binding NarL/FixJ family response regulator
MTSHHGNERVGVLVADDHAAFRGGLRALLSTIGGVEVVGEASTGADAVRQALAVQPDIVLMDIQMPGLDGIAATQQILAASPHIAVLMLTMFEDDESVFAAMRGGARGYLLKGADRQEIVRAIDAVTNGELIFGAAVARRIMEFFAAPRPDLPAQAFPELTVREREILALVARGMNNTQITQRLVLSPKTVRNHISNIFSKLQVADRAQAIVRAREAGLGGERRPDFEARGTRGT